jgi:hypothetical protein
MDMAKWKQAYLDEVQPHVDEPIQVIGALSRVGGMTRLGVGKISPLASIAMGSRAKKASGNLPNNVVVAVTPTKVHVFDYAQKRSSIKVKDEVATWDRGSLKLTTEDKATAVRVNVELPEGAIQLEAVKGMGFNDELIGMLREAAANN